MIPLSRILLVLPALLAGTEAAAQAGGAREAWFPREGVAAAMAQAALGVAKARLTLAALAEPSRRTVPEPPWAQGDPADSMYRSARSALNRGRWTDAITLFSRIYARHPRSAYAGDAYYWEAQARFRRGGADDLKRALEALKLQEEKYPDAGTRRDAVALETRIQGALARSGDAAAAEEIARVADGLARTQPPQAPVAPQTPQAPRPGRGRRSGCGDEDDLQMAAMNALLNMPADRAVPILKRVLAKRDEASACLRRKAVFMVSQHQTRDTEQILLDAARSDPDQEVREQAIFWLSQVDSPAAVAALDSVLRASTDHAVQDKAIFALSQHNSSRARQALRDFALRSSVPQDLRESAIFWIGQSNDPENAAFLRELYGRLTDMGSKKKIIFSVSQSGGREAQQWLLQIAGNSNEPTDVRKDALFWLGQTNIGSEELFGLYDRATDAEMKEQLIFVYSQRSGRAAADRLMQIVRTERDPKLKGKALFWLSQFDDPRVAEFIASLLEKP